MPRSVQQARARGSSGSRNSISSMNSSRSSRPQAGGDAKSGLVPSVGMGKFNLTYGLGRAFGSVEDRKKNFCFNGIGGVGGKLYQTRGPSDGVSKRCKKPVGLTFNEEFRKMFQDYLALENANPGDGETKYGKKAKDWDTSRVTKMEYLFVDVNNNFAQVLGAATFIEDISGWDVSNVTSMEGMFTGAIKFNHNLDKWADKTGKVTNMRYMFGYDYELSEFNNGETPGVNAGATLTLDTSQVTNMEGMFVNTQGFNQELAFSSTGKVTNMNYMFYGASNFNSGKAAGVGASVSGLRNWDTSQVTSMYGMFDRATSFNEPIGSWKTGKVTNMNYMFRRGAAFDQDISDWDVSNVTGMYAMFYGASAFNEDISDWNVSKVTNMGYMFGRPGTSPPMAFNNKGQPLNSWSVYNVIIFRGFAYQHAAFNVDISNWNVSGAKIMEYMFEQAAAFNQNISSWNVSKVTRVRHMFRGATTFNQDLKDWDVSNEADVTDMFTGATAMLAAPAKMPSPRCDGGVGVCYN